MAETMSCELHKIITKDGTTEKLEGSPKGLLEFVVPADDEHNTANHYLIKRGKRLQYEHHLLTVGIESDTYERTVLRFVDYALDGIWGTSMNLLLGAATSIPSLGVVTLHTATVKKMRDSNGVLIGAEFEKDEFSDVLASCLKGKVSRVRNDCYPTRRRDKLAVAAYALSRVGEKAYNVLISNCEHFVVQCIMGVAFSCQAEKRAFLASLLETITQVHTYSKAVVTYITSNTKPIFLKLPQMLRSTPNQNFFYSLFSSGFDDALEALFSVAFVAGEDFVAIAKRSAINSVSTAVIELIGLICLIVHDLYLYYNNGMDAIQVVRRLLIKLSGVLFSVLGTAVIGLICGMIFGPYGLLIGNIAGGMGGCGLGVWVGGKYLVGGRMEAWMVRCLKRWITTKQRPTRAKSTLVCNPVTVAIQLQCNTELLKVMRNYLGVGLQVT